MIPQVDNYTEEEQTYVLDLEPTTKQTAFIHSACLETLFGGARGGGKTWTIILDWLVHSDTWGRFARGIVVRPTLVELEDFIEAARDVLEPAGHTWVEQRKIFRSPKGAILRCRYLENEKDAKKYQGHAYTRIYFEELGNYPNDKVYRVMLGTLRPPVAKGPPVDCKIKSTANPGGPGHGWVKARFIAPVTPGTPFSVNGGKSYRVFLKSLLEDNPHLMNADPGYEDRLLDVGSEELVKAWRYGNWDIVVGQYFHEWDRDKHVIPKVPLPANWKVRYRCHDWGSARPSCTLWFAVANGEPLPGVDRRIPRGALVVYLEFYSCLGPNIGTKAPAEDIGREIRRTEVLAGEAKYIDENQSLCKADPSVFATNGGPSIGEKLARGGAWFKRADNRRVAGHGAMSGWDQIRKRLKGDGDEPMLYIMENCVHLIRTLPELQSDPDAPDDVDSRMEDHAPDCLRYGCMARPYDPPEIPKGREVDPSGPISYSLDQAWQCQFSQSDQRLIR